MDLDLTPQKKLVYASILLYVGAPLIGIFVSLFFIFTDIWQEPFGIALTAVITLLVIICGAIATGYYLSERESWAFYTALGIFTLFCITIIGLPIGGIGIYFLIYKDVQVMF